MIPVFNTGQFLGGAIRSALAQQIPTDEMQICVVDDASTDIDVRALVDSIGQGRVEYFRHPRNVGSVSNFNTCLELARGHLVHLLHADDQVLPGFYSALCELFTTYPEAGAAFSRHRHIDASGQETYLAEPELARPGLVPDWLRKLAVEQRMPYVCTAVRRSVHEELGGYFGVSYGEDWEMWLRIASRHPFAYTPQTLAEYRVHPESISGAKLRSGESVDDLLWIVRTTSDYLPPAMRGQVRVQAMAAIAADAVRSAGNLWSQGAGTSAVRRQLMRAVALGCPPHMLWPALKVYVKTVLRFR